MQLEIEALLAAYLEQRRKEADLIHGLLTALSVAAAGRQRMIDAILDAIPDRSAFISAPAAADSEVERKRPELAKAGTPIAIDKAMLYDDLAASIAQLRSARDAGLTQH